MSKVLVEDLARLIDSLDEDDCLALILKLEAKLSTTSRISRAPKSHRDDRDSDRSN